MTAGYDLARNCVMTPSVYREGEASVGWLNRVPPEGRLRCLSRVKGDFHARFLGGGEPAMAPCYPTAARCERRLGKVRWLVLEGLAGKSRGGLCAAVRRA
jgi:hypothetical protein